MWNGPFGELARYPFFMVGKGVGGEPLRRECVVMRAGNRTRCSGDGVQALCIRFHFCDWL